MAPHNRYERAIVKFNGGNLALLCNDCSTILDTGFDAVDDVVHLCEPCRDERRYKRQVERERIKT